MAGNLTISTINGGPISGMRNAIINGNFAINQRVYASGAATTAGQYTLDRWKVTGTGGIAFSTTNNKTTVTISSGQTLQQVIEGLNLQSGTYVLSWEGSAQGRVGAGSYSSSGVTVTVVGGTDTTIEFNAGTVANVQFEPGNVATAFEHRPYGTELALCQRYYEKSYDPQTSPGTATYGGVARFSYGAGGSGVFGIADFKTSKRAVPTVLTWDEAGNAGRMSFYSASGFLLTHNLNALAANWGGMSRWGFSASTATAGSAGTYTTHWTADAEL